MGCGTSKAAPVIDSMPTTAPATLGPAPEEPILSPSVKRVAVKDADSGYNEEVPAVAPVVKDLNNKPEDKVEQKASKPQKQTNLDLPANPLAIPRRTPKKKPPQRRGSSGLTSLADAPTISQRPASRGGLAFDVDFSSSKNSGKLAPLPRRLRKLEAKAEKQSDTTLDDVQAKLEAAERRRRAHEARLKRKLSAKEGKIRKVQAQGEKQVFSRQDSAKENITESMDKAAENRQAHLNRLREKLKEKERRAQRVRENKQRRALAAQQAS